MDSTPSNRIDNTHAYRDLYEQSVIEASFAWLRRAGAVHHPRYTLADLAKLEQHIAAPLEALMTSPGVAWECCEQALALGEPGEQFTATVIALRSHDVHPIQTAVEAGLSNTRATKGLISALGWLAPDLVAPWIARFLHGKDPRHKYLGVAACGIRRDDPGEALGSLLGREDCRQHAPLYARALRLAGELRRRDLTKAVQAAADSPQPTISFWANWSQILLGAHAAVKNLEPLVFTAGPHRARAVQTAFRVLPVEPAHAWISTLSQDPANARTIIAAIGVLGDPQAVPWLLGKMADPRLARCAGEAFTSITGVDIMKYQLHEARPLDAATLAEDEVADAQASLDDDQGLPWPDVDKVAAWWRQHGAHFKAGQRHFLGKPITRDWLEHNLSASGMRHRQAAAWELALAHPDARFINTCAKVMV